MLVGCGGLEPPTSALDRAERCAELGNKSENAEHKGGVLSGVIRIRPRFAPTGWLTRSSRPTSLATRQLEMEVRNTQSV
jgi:hypothetical protein